MLARKTLQRICESRRSCKVTSRCQTGLLPACLAANAGLSAISNTYNNKLRQTLIQNYAAHANESKPLPATWFQGACPLPRPCPRHRPLTRLPSQAPNGPTDVVRPVSNAEPSTELCTSLLPQVVHTAHGGRLGFTSEAAPRAHRASARASASASAPGGSSSSMEPLVSPEWLAERCTGCSRGLRWGLPGMCGEGAVWKYTWVGGTEVHGVQSGWDDKFLGAVAGGCCIEMRLEWQGTCTFLAPRLGSCSAVAHGGTAYPSFLPVPPRRPCPGPHPRLSDPSVRVLDAVWYMPVHQRNNVEVGATSRGGEQLRHNVEHAFTCHARAPAQQRRGGGTRRRVGQN